MSSLSSNISKVSINILNITVQGGIAELEEKKESFLHIKRDLSG